MGKGVLAGVVLGLTEGKGTGFAISLMKKSAGLSTGQTHLTTLAVLIPSALLLAAAHSDEINFAGALACAVGSVVAGIPATRLAAAIPGHLVGSRS